MGRRRFFWKKGLIIPSTPPSGCIAWYLFLENNLGLDSSSRGLNANSMSFVSFSDPPQNMHLQGGCVSFNSASSYIQIANSSLISFNQSSSFSVEFWFTIPNLSSYLGLLCKGYSTNWFTPYAEYLIQKRGDSINVIRCGLTSMATSEGGLQFNPKYNTWTHLVFTCNKGVCNIYINGVLSGSNTQTIQQGTGPLIIGNVINKAESFRGSMNNLRIYNRELTVSEVLQHYNEEK